MKASFGQMCSASLVVLAACGGSPEAPPVAPVGITGLADANGAPSIEASVYSFDSLDARKVSSVAFAGKPSVIVFVTTYDMLSQGQVDYVIAMAKHDADKTNYAVVALQSGDDRELVEVYKESLNIPFPVAMGDAETARGGGSLGDVHLIPTTVILDATGHVRWRKAGLAKSDEVRAQLKAL